MENSSAENRPSLALGGALLLIAAFFFVYARDIPRTGLAGKTDPGPRAVPLAMAAVVATGGLIELIRVALRRGQSSRSAPHDAADSEPGESSAAVPASYANFAALALGMLVYLMSLSWLGFQLGTALFTSAALLWLGARWWSAMLSGLAIVVVVRVLFVELFHVQLPAGLFF